MSNSKRTSREQLNMSSLDCFTAPDNAVRVIDLSVAVVNPTKTAQKTDFTFKEIAVDKTANSWSMTGASANATNKVDQKPEVIVTESLISKLPPKFSIPAMSINVYRFNVIINK